MGLSLQNLNAKHMESGKRDLFLEKVI